VLLSATTTNGGGGETGVGAAIQSATNTLSGSGAVQGGLIRSNAMFASELLKSNNAYWSAYGSSNAAWLGSNWSGSGISNVAWWGSNSLYGSTNIGSNTFGADSAVDDGTALHDSVNAAGIAALGSSFGFGMTNTLGVGSEVVLRMQAAGVFPGSTLLDVDLRPSQWRAELSGLMAAGRVVITLLCLLIFYNQVWEEFMAESGQLAVATAPAGKAVSGVTLAGVPAQSVRVIVANVLTVGLAGLPVLAVATWENLGIDSSVVGASLLSTGVNAASEESAELAGVFGGLWNWFSKVFPYVTMMSMIANYFVWRVAKFAFSALWLTVYRFLPVLVFGWVVLEGEGAAVVIDNRLHEPVSVIYGSVVEWYQPGERRTELPGSFVVSSGGATNNLSFDVSSGEVSRFIVRESAVTNAITVEVLAEVGERWGFERGMVLGLSGSTFVLVVLFVRRFFGLGFGRYVDGG